MGLGSAAVHGLVGRHPSCGCSEESAHNVEATASLGSRACASQGSEQRLGPAQLIRSLSCTTDTDGSERPLAVTLSSRTRSHLIFTNPELLRATQPFHLLRCFGTLFQNSAGTAKTYELSRPVSAIDEFVSHNWSTKRRDKYLVLALHLNVRAAALAAACATAAAGLLTALGIVPTFAKHPDIDEVQVSVACRVTGFIVFLFMLFLGHEVTGRLGCNGTRLFLDKSVIHQEDTELKQAGIRHLAAFLAHSKRMVIVYTPETYLKRLWTVYELASMLILKPIHHIIFIPTFLPTLVLWITPLWFSLSILHEVLRSEQVWGLLDLGFARYLATICTNAIFLFSFVPLFLVQRRWGQQCQQMWNSLEHFSIQSTVCECEHDRQVVFGNIAAFMRDFEFVEPGASEGEALEAFNGYVRSQLPIALSSFGGRTAVPYGYTVVFYIVQLLKAADTLAVVHLNANPRATGIWTVVEVTLGLAVLPTMIGLFQWVSCEARWARCVLKSMSFTTFFFSMVFLLQQAALGSETSDSWLVIFVGMVVAWFAVVACLYQQTASAALLRRAYRAICCVERHA